MEDLQAVLVELRRQVREAGSQTAWADRHGVSRVYVSLVMNEIKLPGPRMLDAIGYRKVLLYRKKVEG